MADPGQNQNPNQSRPSDVTIDSLVNELTKQKTMPSGSSGPSVPTPPQSGQLGFTPPQFTPPSSSGTPPASGSAFRPVPPPPPNRSSAPTPQYQSSVRTMADDISRTKGGGGAPVSGPLPRPVPPAPTQFKVPSITVPPAPAAGAAGAGSAQPPRPMSPPPAPTAGVPRPPQPQQMHSAGAPSITPPPRPQPQPVRPSSIGISIPPAPTPVSAVKMGGDGGASNRNRSSKIIYIIAGVAVLGGILYWFFVLRSPSVESTPTPSPTVLATPTPVTVQPFFDDVQTEEITLSNPSDPLKEFMDKLALTRVNPGQFKKIALTGVTKGQDDATNYVDVLDRFLLSHPSEISTYLGDDSIFLLYGQQETFVRPTPASNSPEFKRIGFVVESRNNIGLFDLMKTWETAIADNTGRLMGVDKAKSSGAVFQENTYRDTVVRYMNYNTPDKSIDYAIVRATNGKDYLVVSNSRESIFAIIDRLKSF